MSTPRYNLIPKHLLPRRDDPKADKRPAHERDLAELEANFDKAMISIAEHRRIMSIRALAQARKDLREYHAYHNPDQDLELPNPPINSTRPGLILVAEALFDSFGNHEEAAKILGVDMQVFRRRYNLLKAQSILNPDNKYFQQLNDLDAEKIQEMKDGAFALWQKHAKENWAAHKHFLEVHMGQTVNPTQKQISARFVEGGKDGEPSKAFEITFVDAPTRDVE